ncbi:MAG TPA: YceI family protein [Nitrospiria bacterium]|nr:YceI family protein [Nitrospiria bacterium]
MTRKTHLVARLSFLLAMPAIFFFSSLTAAAAEYTLDKEHSHAGFQVRHMVSRLQGEFKEIEGEFNFDEKSPQASKGKFTVKAASINTNHEKRDKHLRSADFFDVEKFPSLTFETKKITPAGDKKYKLEGDFGLHGVTKPVTFDVEFLGADKDPWGGKRAGFTATAKINRKDYGMVWNKVLDSGGFLVGDDVEIVIQVEAIEKTAKK